MRPGHRAGLGARWVAPLLMILLVGPAFGQGSREVQATVTDISGRAYFPVVHGELQAARKSIHVAMFLMQVYSYSSSTSPTLVLVQDLVAAHERGVPVRVILDHSFRYDAAGKDGWIDPKNTLAAEILAAAGVDVYWLPSGGRLHDKLIIIDEEIVISGSHNWSDSALEHNEENGDLIRSPEYAKIKLDRLDLLPVEKMEEVNPPGPVISIPSAFLTQSSLIPQMLTKSDERAFDLMMLIATRWGTPASGLGPLLIPYDETAKALGMDLEMGRTAWRRQITKTLRKLERKYQLVHAQFAFNQPAELTPGELWQGPAAGPSVPVLDIPQVYWDYGWNRKLSLRGKVAYLVCLKEQAGSPTKPWWSESNESLAQEYGTGPGTLGDGLLDLKRQNLLEIVHSTVSADQGYEHRRPNRYRLKPMLSPEEIERRWSQLKSCYGEKGVQEAQNLAAMIDAGQDQDMVEEFAEVIALYGLDQTRKATEAVAAMAPDNPCRHMGYIVTLLKDWTS